MFLAGGNVAGENVNQPLGNEGRSRPPEPAIRTIFAAVAAFEIGGDVALAKAVELFGHGRAVIGMNEVETALRFQFVLRVAEGFFPDRIDLEKTAVKIGDGEK